MIKQWCDYKQSKYRSKVKAYTIRIINSYQNIDNLIRDSYMSMSHFKIHINKDQNDDQIFRV